VCSVAFVLPLNEVVLRQLVSMEERHQTALVLCVDGLQQSHNVGYLCFGGRKS
jgi:hypothetical protein